MQLSSAMDRILCMSKDGKRIGYKKNKKQPIINCEHTFTTVAPSKSETVEEVCKPPECSICCTTIDKGHYVTKCGHVYHLECIIPWFMKKTTCPMCRQHDIQTPLCFALQTQ